MRDLIIIFSIICIIAAIIIVSIYLLICYINKKFGLDNNGKPLNNTIQHPQVIKIELVQSGINKNFDDYTLINKQTEISSGQKNELNMIDLSLNMKNKKVETTFDGGKRIGRIE